MEVKPLGVPPSSRFRQPPPSAAKTVADKPPSSRTVPTGGPTPVRKTAGRKGRARHLTKGRKTRRRHRK